MSNPNQPPMPSDPPPVISYSAQETGEEAEQIAQPTPPPAPPLAPREINPRVLAQQLREPTVRFWWISCALLLAIGLWYTWDQIAEYQKEKDLIENGTRVTAVITSAEDDSRVGRKFPPETPCDMQFQINGQAVNVSGTLVPKDDKDFIVTGEKVVLHVDPLDPARWTNRSEAEPVLRRMIGAVVILPMMAATLVLALLVRRRVLRFWRSEPAALFAVEHVRTGPIAPLSHAVNCAPLSGKDRRTTTIYLPGSYRKPQPGELLWLIHPAGRTSGAIAAAVYEDPANSLSGRA